MTLISEERERVNSARIDGLAAARGVLGATLVGALMWAGIAVAVVYAWGAR